jgi:hypothetical protein
MKTTLELPRALVQEVALRARLAGLPLDESFAELVRTGLASTKRSVATATKKKKAGELPRIECAHAASADEEITPERVAEILIAQDGDWHRDAG